jgi:parvulin-like peptidyl-prolyl isomerase
MTSGTQPTVTTLQEDQLFYEGFERLKLPQSGFAPGFDSGPLRTFTGSAVMQDVQPLQLVALLMTVGRRTDSLNEKMQTTIEQNNKSAEIMQGLLDTAKDAKQSASDSVQQVIADLGAGIELLVEAMEKMTTSFNTSM